MHVEVHGQGPALVLIHGWAMHGGIFAPLLRELVRDFEVHLVDLPGHGRSAERDVAFDPRDCARRLAERIPSATWVGWSLGGLVALHAALDFPARVRSLALIASNPRFVLGEDWTLGVAREVFTQFATGLRTDWRRTLERFLALEAHGSEHAQAELRELKTHLFERGEPSLPVLEQGLRVLDGTDLRARLPELAMPNAWIAGRRDRLVPAAAMQWAAGQARGEYVELPTGHAPFLSHAADVAEAIRRTA